MISVKDLAELLVSLGYGGSYEIVPFPDDRKAIDIGDYYGDFSAIRRDIGWEPQVNLRQGLQRTVAYYLQNHAQYWKSDAGNVALAAFAGRSGVPAV